MKVMRVIYIYFRLITQQLKAILEYQTDFFIMLLSALLTQGLGFIFLWVVFERIPDIHGWRFWEIAFIYAMTFFAGGFATFFFNGISTMNHLVNSGELDRLLVRPVSPILQILGSRVGMNGLGNMLVGGVIIVQSLLNIKLDWTIGKGLFFIVIFISAMVIRTSILFVSSATAFWTESPRNAFPFMIHSLGDLARYPITIYSFGIQIFIAIVVPYAFVGFIPASYLFEVDGWSFIGWFSPLMSVYCIIISIWIFHKGLNRYESVGN
jgi:ABC-2 type transport system permease protein